VIKCKIVACLTKSGEFSVEETVKMAQSNVDAALIEIQKAGGVVLAIRQGRVSAYGDEDTILVTFDDGYPTSPY
jgi:hypothetical protein